MSLLLDLALILFCMLAAAFFSGIETGIISLNRLRLRHLVRRDVKRAIILQDFLMNPDKLLGTTLVGTNVSLIAASVIAADLGAKAFGRTGTALATVLMTIVVLVFAEYVPKAWFQSNPLVRTLPFATLLKWSGFILSPLSSAFSALLRLFHSGSRAGESSQPFVTREELLHLTKEGASSGILTKEEQRMIHGVFQLRAKTCGEVMVPRDKMIYACTETTTDELLDLARCTDVSRFPVLDPDKKTFVGIVHVFDVLADVKPGAKIAKDYMRPVQLVSDDTPADHVLPRMRVTRQPLVLVMNRRYEVIGLVALADVLEEVVGQM